MNGSGSEKKSSVPQSEEQFSGVTREQNALKEGKQMYNVPRSYPKNVEHDMTEGIIGTSAHSYWLPVKTGYILPVTRLN